jgi:glycine dehydrogenase subunit 1
VKLADLLAGVPGVAVLNDSFFNEFTIRLPKPAAEVVETLAARGILAGVPVSRLIPGGGLDDLLLVASTEVNTDEDRAALVAGLEDIL